MRGCGHVSRYSGAQFCSEDCLLAAHDTAHLYPEEWADECSICMERVDLALDDMPEDVRQDPGEPNPFPGDDLKEVA